MTWGDIAQAPPHVLPSVKDINRSLARMAQLSASNRLHAPGPGARYQPAAQQPHGTPGNSNLQMHGWARAGVCCLPLSGCMYPSVLELRSKEYVQQSLHLLCCARVALSSLGVIRPVAGTALPLSSSCPEMPRKKQGLPCQLFKTICSGTCCRFAHSLYWRRGGTRALELDVATQFIASLGLAFAGA